MKNQKYSIAGVALQRSGWFGRMSQWSGAGSLPIEFIKCLSTDEVIVRHRNGQRFSAVIVDASLLSRDRDIIDALGNQCALIAVGISSETSFVPDSVISVSPEFDRGELSQVLATHCRPSETTNSVIDLLTDNQRDESPTGELFAVTGSGGSGSSTTSMALAQGLGQMPAFAGNVLLVDGKRNAELAMYHDTGEVTPGIEELVELVRSSRSSREAVRSLTFDIDQRGYRLLLGFRRASAWTTLNSVLLQRLFDALLSSFAIVIIDIEPDLEGRDDCGSSDVEERNSIARLAAQRASAVYVTTQMTMKGHFSQLQILRQLTSHQISANQLIPVLVHSSRLTLPFLTQRRFEAINFETHSPITLPYLKSLESIHRDVSPFPQHFSDGLAKIANGILATGPDQEVIYSNEAV